MNNAVPTGTLKYGDLFFALRWRDLSDLEPPAIVNRLPLQDGLIEIYSVENRIVVEVARINGQEKQFIDQWITPRLLRDEQRACVFSIQWNHARINHVRINEKVIPRASDERDSFALHEKTSNHAETEPPEDQRSISELFREVRNPSVVMRQAFQFARRLETALSGLRVDTPERVFEIALCLRALLTGTKKNGGRLLFRCAEELGVLPVCYVAPACGKASAEFPLMDEYTIDLDNAAWAFSFGRADVEISFEEWLTRTAIKTQQQDIKHWELIRDIADKFGAHGDVDEGHSAFAFLNPHENLGFDLGVLTVHL